jgi:hypothetical protein
VLLQSRDTPGRLRLAGTMIGAAIFLAGLAHNAVRLPESFAARRIDRQNVARLASLSAEKKDCAIAGYYRCSLLSFALAFGNDFAWRIHSQALRLRYPGTIYFNIFDGRFYSFGTQLSDAELKEFLDAHPCTLMQGAPLTRDEMRLPAEFELEPLVVFRNEGLFRLQRTGGGL